MSVSVTIVRNGIDVAITPEVGPTVTVAPGTVTVSPLVGVSDHAALVNLTGGDPHTQYVLKAGSAMTGALTISSGDSQSIYTATTAQFLSVAKGTAGSPGTTTNPLVKVERLINIAESAVSGDGAEQLAAISAIAVGTVACEVQPVAIFAGAKTFSNTGAPGNDACPIISVGRAMSGATGVGIGAYVQGRRESNSGAYTGLEVRASNYGAADVAYSSSAFSGGNGIWLNADGSFDSAAGITIGNPFGRQFEVGLAFNAQVNGGKTGGVKTTSIRDDGNATNSILINGTHTIGLAIGAGAGYGVIGAAARVSSTALWEVVGPAAGTDPLVQFGQASSAQTYSVVLRTGSAVSRWFMAGAANAIVTGTAAGDAGFAVPSGFSFFLGRAGPGASVVQVKNNGGVSEMGFFAHATAVQQTGGANVTNNMTVGGTNDTIDTWTNLSTYATDAAAIRNAVYQLARLVKQDHDALRAYGLLT